MVAKRYILILHQYTEIESSGRSCDWSISHDGRMRTVIEVVTNDIKRQFISEHNCTRVLCSNRLVAWIARSAVPEEAHSAPLM